MDKKQTTIINLFGEVEPAKTEIVISKKGKNFLSKEQQTFNRLIKKVEKLQKELQNTTLILDNDLIQYGQLIHPVLIRKKNLLASLIKLIYKTFQQNKKSLTNAERKIIKTVLSNQLGNLLEDKLEEMDPEVHKIFSEISGVTYEELKEAEFQNMKEDLNDFFNHQGIDIDIDHLHQNMSPEEMAIKMKELRDQLEEQLTDQEAQWQSESNNKRKSKKQLILEQKEQWLQEAKTKNINTIYRDLVKVLHPDLEQDESLKIEKESLMKEVINAYTNKDLHALLRLELIWIQKEENNPDQLSKEKLTVFNELLKEQINNLSEELNMLLHHPKYELLRPFMDMTWNPGTINFSMVIQEITVLINSMEITIKELSGVHSLRVLKNIIQEYKEELKTSRYYY